MFDPTITEKAAPTPSKSHIKTTATPTETSRKLQTALFDWRDQNARLKFSPAVLTDMGSFIFLSNQIISTIVECARADKIGTVDLLYKETHWRKEWMDEFGESLLSVVRSFYPQNLPTTTPSIPTIRRRKPRPPVKCRACGQLGHNSSNTTCPKKTVARFRRFENESAPPSLPQPPSTPSPSSLRPPPASTLLADSTLLVVSSTSPSR